MHLVVEIVSRWNSSNDYQDMVAGCPLMGIPQDTVDSRDDGTAMHYSGISTHMGRTVDENQHHYRYGDLITIEGWKIDTGALPRYTKDGQ
ncbi:hypothetical protein ACFC18_44480 [Streptomyces sp. NPDC056121]|uniref:hypothetical protein n=1 Tax=unclassified Streptomyces TaxID=2593676 RepID=UPI0033C94EC6